MASWHIQAALFYIIFRGFIRQFQMINAKFNEIHAGGCQIAVERQDNNQAITLVFIHGNSLSLQIWEKQFSGTLSRYYNLLAFDLPGHGNSSRATLPEQVYTIQGFRQVLLDIIRYYKLKNFVLVGHSLGGHVVLESLSHVNGCMAAVILGTPPLHKPLDMQAVYLPNPYTGYLFAAEAPQEELKQLAYAMMRINNPSPPAFLIENYRKTDPQARICVGRSALQNLFDHEVEILAKTSVPVAIVHGEEEQMVKLDYLRQLPLNEGLHQLIVVPEAGHMVPYENPVYFNDILKSLVSPTAVE